MTALSDSTYPDAVAYPASLSPSAIRSESHASIAAATMGLSE